jgi:hypothetical protein
MKTMRTQRWLAGSMVVFAVLGGDCGDGGELAPATEEDPASSGETTIPSRDSAREAGALIVEDGGGSPEDPPLLGMDGGAAVDASASQLVFVSSSTSSAKYGGLAGADARCASLATKAGLAGTWVAWLSNGGGPHAIDRLTSAGPWRLVSGELVAQNKAELASGLRHAIDRDERGMAVPPSRVWTGTGGNGRFLTNDCDKWSEGGNDGRCGETSAVDAKWTSVAVDSCDDQRRLYCFQQ